MGIMVYSVVWDNAGFVSSTVGVMAVWLRSLNPKPLNP